MIRRILPLVLCAFLVLSLVSGVVAEVTVERCDGGAEIKIDGELFARYLIDVGGTPAVWPIIGPTGKPMTRAYPMSDENDAERKDHPHHRSLWFTHGDVNGLSHWHRETIEHKEFVELSGGDTATVVTRNHWLDDNGEPICGDVRTLHFGAEGAARWIDFGITLTALDEAVKFGDTKEGCFGVRVAASMKVDSQPGGKIVNSRGHTNKEAWGKSCPWVDYHGPIDGQIVGLAIFNHPSSFRFPTYWHVRTYGLFAANPFGLHNFEGNKDLDGSHTLEPGKSITLRYRVYLHRGDEKEGGVAKAYEAYAKRGK